MITNPRILFCFAHPDDESFSGVGTACRYGAIGAEIVVVTATRGEAGQAGDPPLCMKEELPARREAELRAAIEIAGIQHLYLLGYRDRELADAPPEEIRGRLVQLIRRHRPQIVITFDPNGFNLHPDHVAVGRFASDAVASAADPRWVPGAGPAHLVQRLSWTSPIPPWDAARSSDLARQPGVDFVIDIEPWRQRKAAALRAHRTQHVSIERYFFSQPDVDRLLSLETYRQAWGPALLRRPLDDLFDGIE